MTDGDHIAESGGNKPEPHLAHDVTGESLTSPENGQVPLHPRGSHNGGGPTDRRRWLFGAVIAMIGVGFVVANYIVRRGILDAERRIILRSELTEGRIALAGSLVLLPVDPEAQVAELVITFPSRLGLEPIILTPPVLRLFAGFVTPGIERYLQTQISDPEEDSVTEVWHRAIPTLIVLRGNTKGVTVTNAAVYDLLVDYHKVRGGRPEVYLKAMTLNSYGTVDDPQAFIDAVFNSYEENIREIESVRATRGN